MNYAAIKKTDIANGPGVRVSLFVSGCRRHCKNCFNSETWDFNYGNQFDKNAMSEITEALDKEYIEGFSILGGEPFEKENRKTVYTIIRTVKEKFPHKTIWCYSGFTFEELLEASRNILELIDVLVDGAFVEEKKNLRLKFRGSENQRIIDVKKSLETGKIVEFEV
ncbi:MAG: anaerobic ribonucleoside-triphosphate reductase activating protein [Hominilimicola sp.]